MHTEFLPSHAIKVTLLIPEVVSARFLFSFMNNIVSLWRAGARGREGTDPCTIAIDGSVTVSFNFSFNIMMITACIRIKRFAIVTGKSLVRIP